MTNNNARITLRDWRQLRKNTLVGFCTIELPVGLVISNIAIHHKNNRWWANLLVRPLLDVKGQNVTGPDGRKQYVALLTWRDRELADRFSRAVVDLIRAAHRDDLVADGDLL